MSWALTRRSALFHGKPVSRSFTALVDHREIIGKHAVFVTPVAIGPFDPHRGALCHPKAKVDKTHMSGRVTPTNLDLSVGSVLGLCAMSMAIVQVWWLPDLIGLGSPMIWIIASLVGLLIGTLVGAFHGYLVAYLGIPAFIVTLGGLLVWRGLAFLLARGETISPVDPTFALLGGGPYGSIGAAGSWIVGILACLGILGMLYMGRRQRRRFKFPLSDLG